MYYKLSEKRTKKHYREILEETLSISKDNFIKYKTSLWQSIVNQICDIRENVIEKHIIYDWEQMYERYTLGTIAIQYFEENDDMQDRLCDIFGGAVHYAELSE